MRRAGLVVLALAALAAAASAAITPPAGCCLPDTFAMNSTYLCAGSHCSAAPGTTHVYYQVDVARKVAFFIGANATSVPVEYWFVGDAAGNVKGYFQQGGLCHSHPVHNTFFDAGQYCTGAGGVFSEYVDNTTLGSNTHADVWKDPASGNFVAMQKLGGGCYPIARGYAAGLGLSYSFNLTPDPAHYKLPANCASARNLRAGNVELPHLNLPFGLRV